MRYFSDVTVRIVVEDDDADVAAEKIDHALQDTATRNRDVVGLAIVRLPAPVSFESLTARLIPGTPTAHA